MKTCVNFPDISPPKSMGWRDWDSKLVPILILLSPVSQSCIDLLSCVVAPLAAGIYDAGAGSLICHAFPNTNEKWAAVFAVMSDPRRRNCDSTVD